MWQRHSAENSWMVIDSNRFSTLPRFYSRRRAKKSDERERRDRGMFDTLRKEGHSVNVQHIVKHQPWQSVKLRSNESTHCRPTLSADIVDNVGSSNQNSNASRTTLCGLGCLVSATATSQMKSKYNTIGYDECAIYTNDIPPGVLWLGWRVFLTDRRLGRKVRAGSVALCWWLAVVRCPPVPEWSLWTHACCRKPNMITWKLKFTFMTILRRCFPLLRRRMDCNCMNLLPIRRLTWRLQHTQAVWCPSISGYTNGSNKAVHGQYHQTGRGWIM